MIVSVKLDANKIKEHLAAENATTRSSRRRRNEKQRERSNQDREESGRAGGGKMHPVKMPPPMAQRMPLCSVSPSETAGKTGRAVRSRARPHAKCADAFVPSGKKGARSKLGRHDRNKGGGRGHAMVRNQIRAQEGKKGEKLVHQLTKLAGEKGTTSATQQDQKRRWTMP